LGSDNNNLSLVEFKLLDREREYVDGAAIIPMTREEMAENAAAMANVILACLTVRS